MRIKRTYPGEGPIWNDEDMGIEGWQDTKFTAVNITTDDGGTVLGHGVARLNPQDKFDPEIGQELAIARAFESVARRKMRRVNGAIKHAEDMAIERRDRRALEGHRVAIYNVWTTMPVETPLPWSEFKKKLLADRYLNGQ